VLQLKALRVGKCLFTEDYPKEVLVVKIIYLKKKFIAKLNLGDLQNFIKNKRIEIKEEINLKYLQDKNIIRGKYEKLKVLGSGELKDKLKIKTDYISKSAKTKIENAGGLVSVLSSSVKK
tara:strand:- start:660 stop:1019 length:360 start_codon:yes stop_codon:yes gene_type:complete